MTKRTPKPQRPRWNPTPATLARLRAAYAELDPDTRESVWRKAMREGKWLLEVLEARRK